VKIPEAPFQYHMFVFNSDGTMLQSNPDAGDPNTSDSNGMGVWLPDGKASSSKSQRIERHTSSSAEGRFPFQST
jgi:hypothetical protein